MVKETRFRHHPVRIEESLFLGVEELDLTGYYEDLQTAVLATASGVDDTVFWEELVLGTLVTIPTDAIAAILDVQVNDSGSAAQECFMGFCPTGAIWAGRAQYVYCGDVNDRIGSRIVIVGLSTDESIHYHITASGANFDYTIKLLGWLIGGTDISRFDPVAEDLFCRFRI